jgi:hypothetical protein
MQQSRAVGIATGLETRPRSNPGRGKRFLLCKSPDSYLMGTGVPSWEYSGRGVKLTAHLRLAPWCDTESFTFSGTGYFRAANGVKIHVLSDVTPY